jgi:multimeric flavodoxin WrbA
MHKTQTIALFASARRHGNTGRLMDSVAKQLKIEVVDLGEANISAYDYEHRNRGDDFEPLLEHVLRHDQILFASPVYWYAASPPMKIFIDRISDLLDLPELRDKGRQLRRKRAFVLCTSIEDDIPRTFIDAFRETFEYLGMQYGGYAHLNCRDGYDVPASEREVERFVQLVTASVAS